MKTLNMEKTKTAMQQLIDFINGIDTSNEDWDVPVIASYIKIKAEKLCDTVEKEQIINDFKAGADSHESMMAVDFNERPETYYNETYGNENS